MSKYVEKETVMQAFSDRVMRSNNSDFVPVPTWNDAVQIVDDFPAADVEEVRHGQWKSRKNWSRCVCSVCSWESGNEYNYCPNCGAKMTEEET